MMFRRSRRGLVTAAVLGALAAAALIGAGCGDDDDDGDGGAAAQPTATTASAQPTGGATEPAGDGETTVVVSDTSLGPVLADADGRTMYVFKNDVADSGTSACTGGCATAWPPFTVEGEPSKADDIPGEIGTITRDDGTTQVTYNGLPLHRFINDQAPGDTMGEGVAGLWTVAKP